MAVVAVATIAVAVAKIVAVVVAVVVGEALYDSEI